ncbi:cupin domain-containing protein [Amylibacter sp. SFDW26]|uniref:cupin domain-containing protein n=1 Tax=Amylibacter sp. SFDW26 TaxID=2652722 RepID=UPI001261BF57|nr:cupin domain-containing protein [Amylibacter sp. SFDW26]KAB7613868.1 cupin domain-containing protein [Amylibacter sp. SFDW26]
MYAETLSADRQNTLSCNLFVDDRSRVSVTTVDPEQEVQTTCHIHASKQITVLDGYAEVDIEHTRIKLFEGQSAHIPNGTAHKIMNLGKIPLKYVEIRTGPYVKDDDLLS